MEEWGPKPAESEEAAAAEGAENKPENRKKRTKEQTGPAAKAARAVGADSIMKLDEFKDATVLAECPLSNQKNPGLVFQIHSGSGVKSMVLLNKSNTEVRLMQGFIVAGFGKGSWKERKDDEANKDKEILFDLKPETFVLQGNQLKVVKDIVNALRMTKPASKVCYHELVDAPTAEDPSAWSLKRTLNVYFVPGKSNVVEGENQDPFEAKQAALASLFPNSLWETAKLASIVFTVRWTSPGLMPVRPQICLTASMTLPPESGVKL